MSIATRLVSSIARPRLDLKGCVLYAPLWRPDLGGATSFTTIGDGGIPTHLCTVTGAPWGIQGRTFVAANSDKIRMGAPAVLNFGAGSYTIGAWAYYTTSANDRPYFNTEDAAGRRRINLRSSAFSRQATAGGIQEKTFTAVTANVWHQIFGVYDSAAATLEAYVDGVSQGTTSSIDSSALADATENEIGYWTTLDFKFGGIMGEVNAFNRALTAQEIPQNYLRTRWRYL